MFAQIDNYFSAKSPQLQGVTSLQHAFLLRSAKFFEKKNHIFICESSEMAERVYDFFKSCPKSNHEVIFLPNLETNPYLPTLFSRRVLNQRFFALNRLAQKRDQFFILISDLEAITLKLPPISFFQEKQIKIATSDILSPEELAKKLVEHGYSHSFNLDLPGTFLRKGEIFDIFPFAANTPIRLEYFDEMIEQIYEIDKITYKTNKDHSFDELLLAPTPQIFLSEEFAKNIRKNIPIPPPAFKERFLARQELISKINQGEEINNLSPLIPLFFEETSSLVEYLNEPNTCFHLTGHPHPIQQVEFFLKEMQLSFQEQEEQKSSNLLPSPEKLFCNPLASLINKENIYFSSALTFSGATPNNNTILPLEDFKIFCQRHNISRPSYHEFLMALFEFLKEHFAHEGSIFISKSNKQATQQLQQMLEEHEVYDHLKDRIHWIDIPLDHGFYNEIENSLIIADTDLFSAKTRKVKRSYKANLDLFAEQLATLRPGDYVVHKVHGIGKYMGLESIETAGFPTDFLVIHYAEEDKVYVPVYKMDQVQKHADQQSFCTLSNLRSKKFDTAKQRAREAAKKLAFDLIKLQAQRQSAKAFAFSEPDEIYKEFELKFPFEETEDQIKASLDVLDDMQQERPMDRLVCGDVGFGKTEVAIRGAFKAVLDKKQVAVLVPTTILALQHEHSFIERLKEFPVTVKSLSRFKTAKETKEIKDQLKKGTVDIIIGTHKLLASDIEFKDLGLIIIDEEQRFGVAHKEKLKLLKASVDVLTLTATPIPRTLQLAFLGIRDLSLINSAPPKRQSIKTLISVDEDQVIANAIEQELAREGQIFFVHNRVNDIELVYERLIKLVPRARIIIAHGQLNERELEKRISAFYNGQYDILLSTTIIESGVDIPRANTMIVNNADRFGLSQLHQLRGRIGRSDKKAYAYFLVKSFQISGDAERRLKALQTYAELGSGFSIASSDLEIRGAGDILGADQSGQIEAVGLELYMELLEEALQELKGEKQLIRTDVEIQIPEPALIPESYIPDSPLRLKYYKRLSSSKEIEELDALIAEISDRFGELPAELSNLKAVLQARIYLSHCAVKQLKVGGMVFSLKFDEQLLAENTQIRDSLVNFFLQRPRQFTLRPDFSVICQQKEKFQRDKLVEFSKMIARQSELC